MRFPVRDCLTEAELQKGFSYVLKDGMCSQTLAVLTTGVFLVAFALKLGASIALVGFIAAIPPLTQMLSFFAAYIVQKYKKRRALCVISSFSSRIFWLFIAVIPFLLVAPLSTYLNSFTLFSCTLFVVCMICHGELARRRPEPSHLTGYYLSMPVQYCFSIRLRTRKPRNRTQKNGH
jgi:hypothetical protein